MNEFISPIEAAEFPRNLLDLERMFPSDLACLTYLSRLRWPHGFKCPKCQGERYWLTKRATYFCISCRHQTSPTAGTIFHRSRHPMVLWFRMMWLMVSEKNGISALGAQRQLGMNRYETAWEMLHKLRVAMVCPDREQLSGEVEVDETLVGSVAEGKVARQAWCNKQIVVIAAEIRHPGIAIGRIRMQAIADVKGMTLGQFIKAAIAKGSTIETDGWKGYKDSSLCGYQHRQVKSATVDPDRLTPRVHRIASLLKRWLLGTHHGRIERNHFQAYLEEFTFRFNRRTSLDRGKLFFRLAQQTIRIVPPNKKPATHY